MHRSISTTATAVAAAALLVPAAAQAKTWHAGLGIAKAPSGSPGAASYYDFFPNRLKIHAGDKISFKINGFGVVYSGKRSKIKPLTNQDPKHTVSGAKDPTGAPFWFNGQPDPVVDAFYLGPQGDGKVRHHGTDSSGVALSNKPYVLKFPKRGTFTLRDALHPGITAKVKVVRKHQKASRKSALRAAALKLATKRVAEAQKLENYTPPAGTISVGHDSKHVGLYQFFPDNLQVKAGQPVTVTVNGRVNDIHDLAIGPDSFTGPLAANFFPTLAQTGGGLEPAVALASQAPSASGLSFAGASTNGGFVNTGLLDANAKTALPGSVKLTFTQPGTYHYVCLLHSSGTYVPGAPQMQGTITVK